MESEYSREIEENRNKFREMELLLIESRNKQAKAETELKSREHVSGSSLNDVMLCVGLVVDHGRGDWLGCWLSL
jgi:hypothetical protein